MTGKSVRASYEAEKSHLGALPVPLPEPFDLVQRRRVSLDATVRFEGRTYSVPFAWAEREIEVRGCARVVQLWAEGKVLAEHPRRTRSVPASGSVAHAGSVIPNSTSIPSTYQTRTEVTRPQSSVACRATLPNPETQPWSCNSSLRWRVRITRSTSESGVASPRAYEPTSATASIPPRLAQSRTLLRNRSSTASVCLTTLLGAAEQSNASARLGPAWIEGGNLEAATRRLGCWSPAKAVTLSVDGVAGFEQETANRATK